MQILTLQTVLVATDLRDASLPAIEIARALAHASGGALHVVHVGSSDQDRGEATHAQLATMGIPLDGASVHTVRGEPTTGILHIAEELSADVIVIGPHENLGGPAGVGTALEVATKATVPCMVVASKARIPVKKAVVAVDGSDTARGAMAIALSWASGLRRGKSAGNVELIALHVAERADGTRAAGDSMLAGVEQLKREAGNWAGVDIESVVIEGDDVASAIASYVTANAVDFVVLGTHGVGRPGAGPLGHVATTVAEQVSVPVLLVPPAIWQAYAQERVASLTEPNAA